MKKQILTLVIGILIGSILTAGVFLIVKPKNSRKMPDFSQMDKDGKDFDGKEFDFNRDGRKSKNDKSNDTKEDSKVEEQKDEKQN